MVGSIGKISQGISPRSLIDKTIQFTRSQLQAWKDDPDRAQAANENVLNGQLCKYLNFQARKVFPMVVFHREEEQAPGRTVDFSVLTAELQGHTIYDAFLVMEGKRLPPPSASREREYLTGLSSRSGGVQRFKLGLHGARLSTAVMVGYIEERDAPYWRGRLNRWVKELAALDDTDADFWQENETLRARRGHGSGSVAMADSKHPRAKGQSSEIALVHLWVKL